MPKLNDIIDYSLISVATVFSLENIESIIGIVLLSIQVIWLCVKLGVKLYNYIKRNTDNDPTNDVKDEEITDIINEISDIRKKNKK